MGNKFGPSFREREFRRAKRRALVGLRKGIWLDELSMGTLNQVDEYRYDLIQLAIEEEFPTAKVQRDSIGLFINVLWPLSEGDRGTSMTMNIIDIEMYEDGVIWLYLCGIKYAKAEVPISDPEAFKKVFDFLRVAGLE